MKQAKELGTSDVIFTVSNNSNTTLSNDVVNSLRDIKVADAYGSWYLIHSSVPDSEIEYTLKLIIKNIQSLPEKVTTNHYDESKEIVDGYEFLYDDKGNIVKDSLGEPVKVPDYKIVTATVHETWQEKIGSISGELQYIDRNGKIIRTIAVKSEGVFQNYYATASGYYDALTTQSKSKIGGKPLPFPTDNQILIDAIHQLNYNVNNVMDDYNDEYLNL